MAGAVEDEVPDSQTLPGAVEVDEALCRAALASLGEGVLIQDQDSTIVAANAAAPRILGLTMDQMLGRTSLDPAWRVMHRDGSPFPGETHPGPVALRERRSVRDVVMGVQKPDGAVSWILVNVEPIRGAEGAATGSVVCSYTDITAQTEADDRHRLLVESARSEIEEAYELLAENITGVVFRGDERGCLTWISDSVEQMIGLTPADVVGRAFLELVHPDDQATVRRTQAGIARGVPGSMRIRVATKDGPYRWVDARVRPVLDSTGDVVARMGSWTDVDAEVEARAESAGSEALLRTALRAAAIGMALTDQYGAFTLVNPALSAMLGRSEQWLLQHRVDEVIAPQHRDLVDRVRASLDHGEAEKFEGQLQLLRADGALLWARVAAVLVAHGTRDDRSFMIQAVDVTAERVAQQQLRHQAFHDALTGLRNRAWILDMLEVDLRNSRRTGSHVGVFFIDLDNFKLVNDSLGHAAGDEVLTAVAERISSILRPGDRLGRFGGDEFVVVVPDVLPGPDVEKVAERIGAAVSAELVVQGHRIVPTASMGIAVSGTASTASSLLREADSALFRAKDAGRARWHFFDEAMHAQAVARLTLEDELRNALSDHEFVLSYQPIVRLSDCVVVGHEALVRWQHPERGLLVPGDFLEVAEDSGLIVGIGHEVLDQVCALLASDRTLPGPVNVNVSGVELSARDWQARFVETVRRHGVDPGRLVVEVTETAVLSLVDTTHSDLVALRDLGVGVQVDDFGTGFSSISLLRDLPVTGLKLDSSFVRDLTDDASPANALAAGVAGLAQGLSLVGVAEGIESAAQHTTLLAQGWTHGQGYRFGRPEARPRRTALVHRPM